MSKVLITVALAAAALVFGTVAFRARPRPPAPQPAAPAAEEWAYKAEATAEQVFGHLTYTPQQSAALVEAGFALFAGTRPTETLSAASLEQLRQVRAMFQIECTAGPCTHYRRDVFACIEEAGELIGIAVSEVEAMDRRLLSAAMGVSVVTRELPYQRPAALAEFCRKLVVAREKFRPRPPTG